MSGEVVIRSQTPRTVCLALAGATVLALAVAPAGDSRASGAIYTYVDGDGVTHFTNRPQDRRYSRVLWTRSAGSRASLKSHRRAPRERKYDGLIGLAAREHHMPPALIKAVIAAESRFDAAAVSHKGAQGLMQLMPRTAAALGVQDPMRPRENVDGGARYLRSMVDRYGDLPRALAAYNAGPEAVDRYRGIPPYPETRDYVRRVLTYYREYHGDFGG